MPITRSLPLAASLRTSALGVRLAAAVAMAFPFNALAQMAVQTPLAAQTPAVEEPADAPPAPAALPAGAVGGMGDINLYPKRVVIDSRNRVASIGLYNKTATTGDYDITIDDMMMTPQGSLIPLDQVSDPVLKAKVKVASGFVRWSPHRVTLPGNEAQLVRVMAHLPPDLPPGEYRSHFSAIAVPPDMGGVTIPQAADKPKSANGMGVHITPRFGISIPVILRVGDTTLSAGLASPGVINLPTGGKALRLRITREGTRSAFGDLAVTAPGAKSPVALLRGVGVYTEIDSREVTLPFDPKADPKSYASGAKLTITYTDDDADPGKVLAKQDYVVP